MCGLAGFLGQAWIDDDRIAAGLRAMRHRGPDGCGSRRAALPDGRHLVLLHARLAILDLDPRSDQPFRDGPLTLAYNGEVYNYLEVRRDLAAGGEHFVTDSDTEVLARALRRWGAAKALDACEGMWAFAAFDETTGTLTLSRDRFGEKPLYLWRRPEGLFFGSEIKALAALAGSWPAVNTDHIRRYLVNGYKSLHKTADTYFQGVEKLPPATTLTITADGERLERYWTPHLNRRDETLTFADAVARTRELLIRSVETRLRADVPIAFCMSGGVDSNTMIGIAVRHFGQEVHGFTISQSDARYEEDEMVDAAVKALGVRHSVVPVPRDRFLPRLRDLVRRHDQPISSNSYYAHSLLMEAIHAEGYKVAISGAAADELFSGYYDHHNLFLAEIADRPALHAAAKADWEREFRPHVRNPFLRDADTFVRDPGLRDHIYLNADLFASWLREPFHEPFTEERYCDGLLRNRMLNETFHESIPCTLQEDDLNAMAYSIENRTPFLDRALFEFAVGIPTPLLFRNGRAKAVLREAARGFAPDEILDNPRKVGFNAPIRDFLDLDDPATRGVILDDGPVYELVRRDAVEALMAKPHLENSESKFFFNFLNARFFLDEAR